MDAMNRLRMPSLKTTSFKGCPAWFHRRGQLLRSHDLWHGRGGGVRCYRPTTNNQPTATRTKYCTICYCEWCFLWKALLFERLSPPPLLFDYFFSAPFAGFHIFAVWQPFFCRQWRITVDPWLKKSVRRHWWTWEGKAWNFHTSFGDSCDHLKHENSYPNESYP